MRGAPVPAVLARGRGSRPASRGGSRPGRREALRPDPRVLGALRRGCVGRVRLPVRPRCRLEAACRDESGQVLLLGIGLTAVVLALVLVIASATAVQLDLKRLAAVADSAAAQAADGVDEDGYFAGATTTEGRFRLDDAAVLAEASRDVAAQPVHGGLGAVRIVDASSPDGVTAVVTLTAHSQPPFLPWDLIPSDGFTLTVTSTAHLETRP